MNTPFDAMIDRLLARLERFGYDNIYDVRVDITYCGYGDSYPAPRITAAVDLRDDFQANIPWDERIQHGSASFVLSDDETEFVIPPEFIGREMRELRVINRRIGHSKELFEKMTSAAGREFVAKMEEELKRSRTLLECVK